MAYKYITENNLYNKQTYMYSEYGGTDFLQEYIASRQKYLDRYEELDNAEGEQGCSDAPLNDVIRELSGIKRILETGKQDREVMELVNAYTKSFEVRKRIYERYDNDWKPIGNKEFEDYEAYLLLAECLVLSYKNTKCLKYFSCMLKVDDTLLSVQDKLNTGLKGVLYQAIKKELDIFYELVKQNEINLEE